MQSVVSCGSLCATLMALVSWHKQLVQEEPGWHWALNSGKLTRCGQAGGSRGRSQHREEEWTMHNQWDLKEGLKGVCQVGRKEGCAPNN